MKKTLTFADSSGISANLIREQKIRVNYGSMSEIWCRNIVADGAIQNLLVDGLPPEHEDQEKLGCLLAVRKKFLRTLYRGDCESVTWSYNLLHSFPNKQEFIDHDVTPGTQLLELIVHLPENRPCRGVKLEEKVAGEPSRQLQDPDVTRSGIMLYAKVKSPKEGRTIRLSWQW
jgi:hypothetical protein